MRYIKPLTFSLILMLSAPAYAGEGTAVRPLPKGTILTADMVEGVSDKSPLIGKQLKRPVFQGKPISISDVTVPDLVTRQSFVTIEYRRRGLLLSMPGRALKAGAFGDTIPVIIEGRRRPVMTTIIGPAQVEVKS